MTTSTEPTHPLSPVENSRSPLHLRLHAELGAGKLDGAWWPQSRDLPLELADLVDHFPSELGVVYRVVFSRSDWDTSPRRVRVARGPIKVGSYPTDDTSRVWLFMSTPPHHPLVRDPRGECGDARGRRPRGALG